MWRYHLLAIATILVWGVTFVNSKVLLLHGLAVHEIFVIRFGIAYLCIWTISPRRLWASSLRDEAIMMLLGITGGSLYFVAENMAVKLSFVSNVSFIVCTAPLFTTLLGLLFIKGMRATRGLVIGSMLAIAGMAMVIFNGQFVFKLNPAGDLLAFCGALCWAVYSLLMKSVATRYGAVFVSRKVFFYGLLTALPLFAFMPWQFPAEGFLDPAVWGNLLFLGFIASFACFVLWNLAIKKVGAISVSNYVYLNPISTVVCSALVLHEPTTWIAILGSALILSGVFVANKRGV